MLCARLAEAKKPESGESTKEQYDEWRYKYPKPNTHQHWAKGYTQELFDFIDEYAKEAEKKEKIDIKKPYQFSVVISENQ